MTPTQPQPYDIFVSYAHVDDQPLSQEYQGWVTTLVGHLKVLLAQRLGRQENFSLWMDHRLAGNAQLTPEILNALRTSATMVLILSPAYVASEWCLREMGHFLETVRQRSDGGPRVFVLEYDKVDPRPPKLADLLGYRFWEQEQEGRATRSLGFPKPNPDKEPRYFQLLNRLSYDLAEVLRGAKPPPATRGTVYLAEVTDDLDDQREEVKGYLTQAGLRVLPESYYPRDPEAYRQAAKADLGQCKLFAQLLSAAVGKMPRGYVGLQHDLARELKLPVLQWRSRDLDTGKVANAEHRALLESETVAAEGLEEFKSRVVQVATAPPPPPSPKLIDQQRKDCFVFMNAEEADRSLVEEISKALEKRQIGYALPLRSTIPAEVRQDLEMNLTYCDGLILIYGKTRSNWVRAQVLESRKIMYKRETPLRIAVYEGPPDQTKDPLNVKLPNMLFINCRKGLDEGELERFLDSLQAEATS